MCSLYCAEILYSTILLSFYLAVTSVQFVQLVQFVLLYSTHFHRYTNSESFQDTAIVCRNGILLQNSLLIFLLFKEELQNIQTVDEELTIFLPEVDIELVQEMIEKLLSHSKKPPNSKSSIAQFSLILPFETQIKPNKCEMGRRRMQRTESVCAICGKNLKRTKWEAEKHEQLHSENPGNDLLKPQ